jgi:hypothetical protein
MAFEDWAVVTLLPAAPSYLSLSAPSSSRRQVGVLPAAHLLDAHTSDLPQVILIMTLYEGFKVSRFSSSRYLKTFFRDGIFYYIYILRRFCITLFRAVPDGLLVISAGNIVVLVAGPVR